jgi:hypothetical protein
MLLLIYLGLFGIGFRIGRVYRRWKIMRARVRENNRKWAETHLNYAKVTRIKPDYNYVKRGDN